MNFREEGSHVSVRSNFLSLIIYAIMCCISSLPCRHYSYLSKPSYPLWNSSFFKKKNIFLFSFFIVDCPAST